MRIDLVITSELWQANRLKLRDELPTPVQTLRTQRSGLGFIVMVSDFGSLHLNLQLACFQSSKRQRGLMQVNTHTHRHTHTHHTHIFDTYASNLFFGHVLMSGDILQDKRCLFEKLKAFVECIQNISVLFSLLRDLCFWLFLILCSIILERKPSKKHQPARYIYI